MKTWSLCSRLPCAVSELFVDLPAEKGVAQRLVLAQPHAVAYDREGRQVGEDVVLQPPQEKRRDQGLELRALLAVPVALDGLQVAYLKVLPSAEQGGVQEVEDAPEIAEVIFDGRARHGEAVARGERERGACARAIARS